MISQDYGLSWTNRQSAAGARDWWTVACSADCSRIIAGVFNGYLYTSNDTVGFVFPFFFFFKFGVVSFSFSTIY